MPMPVDIELVQSVQLSLVQIYLQVPFPYLLEDRVVSVECVI
jgi:hypothetical protein